MMGAIKSHAATPQKRLGYNDPSLVTPVTNCHGNYNSGNGLF
jgi:hypothetical protein